MRNNSNRCTPAGFTLGFFLTLLSISCGSGGLFGPSDSVDGTWSGTFLFSTQYALDNPADPDAKVTASVTATLSETSAEEDTVTGSFTATRSGGGVVDDTDGGSVQGTIGSGIGLPTVALTFVSAKYCDWTVTAVLDEETMTGTWSTTSECTIPSSGAITMTRS